MTRTRPALALAALLAAPHGAPLYGATIDARSLAYIPASYSPGEELVAQATILPEAGEKLEALDLKAGAGLPAQGPEADPEIRELRISRAGAIWQLSLRFVPWSPGRLLVPAIRVKGLQIPAIPYSAISVLGSEDRDPSPPRRQRDPPGTALFLYGFAGLLLVLVLGGAGVAAYLVPAARALLARRRAAQAFRRFVTSLDYLAAEAGSAAPASFFAALSRAFRLYLATRVLPSAPALTAAEISALPDTAFPAPATKDRAAAFFAQADRARFGGEGAGSAKAREAAATAAISETRILAEANEEALLARL